MPPTINIQRDVRSMSVNADGSWAVVLECGHTTILQTGSTVFVGRQLTCDECAQLVSASTVIPA